MAVTPLTKAVTRMSTRTYEGRHADARGRKLAIALLPGDMIMIRPAKTQRAEYILVSDVYNIALERRVKSDRMMKVNAKKRRAK